MSKIKEEEDDLLEVLFSHVSIFMFLHIITGIDNIHIRAVL